jgi:hypothetical protein
VALGHRLFLLVKPRTGRTDREHQSLRLRS